MENNEYDFEDAGQGGYELPEGFEVISDDVKAYWEPSMGPLMFIPRSVRLMDNGQDKDKSSCLILGVLLKPANLKTNAPRKEDRVIEHFEANTPIGVWAKAGMRELIRLGGAHVWMAPDGSRAMGGGQNDMQLFKIGRLKTGPAGGPLELLEDARRDSVIEAQELKLKKKRYPWYLEVLGDEGVVMAQARRAYKIRQETLAAQEKAEAEAAQSIS